MKNAIHCKAGTMKGRMCIAERTLMEKAEKKKQKNQRGSYRERKIATRSH